MDTGQYDFVEAILTAHQIGRTEGFENALDVRAIIEADGFEYQGSPADFNADGFTDADAVYLEALAAKQQELEARIELIEKHYLGVDFQPERPKRFADLREAPKRRGCDDPSCECGDTICS